MGVALIDEEWIRHLIPIRGQLLGNRCRTFWDLIRYTKRGRQGKPLAQKISVLPPCEDVKSSHYINLDIVCHNCFRPCSSHTWNTNYHTERWWALVWVNFGGSYQRGMEETLKWPLPIDVRDRRRNCLVSLVGWKDNMGLDIAITSFLRFSQRWYPSEMKTVVMWHH